MLVISGVVPRSRRGLGEIHDLPDQQGLLSKVTAFSHSVDGSGGAAGGPRPRAATSSHRGARARCTSRSPLDVLQRDAGDAGPSAMPAPAGPPVADPQALDARGAALLAAAERPLILLGGGARRRRRRRRWRSPGASARRSA